MALLLGYLGAHLITYCLTISGTTFQSPYCLDAPADNTDVIRYLEAEHIKYVWAANFVANPILFKTEGRITAADPQPLMIRQAWLNRLPEVTSAVARSDRPTLLVLTQEKERNPQILQTLNQLGVSYKLKGFPSQPGVKLLAITPLNQTVTPQLEPDMFADQFSCHR